MSQVINKKKIANQKFKKLGFLETDLQICKSCLQLKEMSEFEKEYKEVSGRNKVCKVCLRKNKRG